MKKIIEETPAEEEEVKRDKKTIRKEKAEKRKSAKKQDKLTRWSGAILFVILLVVGFLMWVSGEVQNEAGMKVPVERSQIEREMVPSGQGKVVVE